jgi:broad specificity phosphatase PhoE
MPGTLHVLLVRHGESVGNAGHATEDAASTELTALGVRQAEAVAAALPGEPALIVVSAYARSQRTAEPARGRYPHVPVEVWPVHEFTYLGPQAYAGTTVEERRPAVDEYWHTADPHLVAGEGAESFAAFIGRVGDVRERLERAPVSPVVIFSHKKFINALLWTWLAGAPAVSSRRMGRYRGFDHAMALPNGGCIDLRIERGADSPGAAARARVWLSPVRTGHLEGLSA